MHEGSIVIKGFVQMKCRTFRLWRRRFLVLRASHLLDVYTNESMLVRARQRTILSCGNGRGNELKLYCGNGDCFRLKLDNVEEKRIWWSAARYIASPKNGRWCQHIPVCGSDFRVVRLVGKGAFGSVFKVKKVGSSQGEQQHYAMKIIKKGASTNSALVERFMAERARHPFIVQLRYSYQSSHNFYLISDFYGGGSLHYHLRKSKEGFFPEGFVQFWAVEILLALEHLHSIGILYRDLKLENVLLDSNGHVGITDFGLSTDRRDVSQMGSDPKRRREGHVGTPFYLAPEVLLFNSTSETVDWWAFGVLLHELLVGSTPFKGCDRESLFLAILNEPLNLQWNLFTSGKKPGSARSLSKSATFVLEGLLRKDPVDRLGCEDLKCAEFFQKFQMDPSFIKNSYEPPFKPQHYNSEANVKNLKPLLGRSKKQLSSTSCGGARYVPGFSFVRTSSKTNISEEMDSTRELSMDMSSLASISSELRSQSLPSAPLTSEKDLDSPVLQREGIRRNSLSPTSPAGLGWHQVHKMF